MGQIIPMFDEEDFVRDMQVVLGFEHEALAQEILAVAKTHYTVALGRYNLGLLDRTSELFRGQMVSILVEASRPQEVQSEEEDASKKW